MVGKGTGTIDKGNKMKLKKNKSKKDIITVDSNVNRDSDWNVSINGKRKFRGTTAECESYINMYKLGYIK